VPAYQSEQVVGTRLRNPHHAGAQALGNTFATEVEISREHDAQCKKPQALYHREAGSEQRLQHRPSKLTYSRHHLRLARGDPGQSFIDARTDERQAGQPFRKRRKTGGKTFLQQRHKLRYMGGKCDTVVEHRTEQRTEDQQHDQQRGPTASSAECGRQPLKRVPGAVGEDRSPQQRSDKRGDHNHCATGQYQQRKYANQLFHQAVKFHAVFSFGTRTAAKH
jgi:hypothetical protein